MRAFNALARLLAVGVPVVLMAGCDLPTDSKDANPSAASWTNTTDLQSADGGYTLTDEPVAFGDPEMTRVEVLERDQSEIADADTLPSDNTYVVRILWGQLRGNREAQNVTDWTGSVRLNRGRLAVARVIAFEVPRDHVVLPRTNPQTVEFVSHTQPHLDGLLLVVQGATTPDSTTFSFRTAPYSHTWTLAELAGANLVIPVDDQGNAVAVNAMPLRAHECPSGFARGAWVVRAGDAGIFRGTWIGPRGAIIGQLHGHFGIDPAGTHLWFGKVIGPDGRAIGLARGQWAPNADPTQPGGTFQGTLRTLRGQGTMRGRYIPGREGDAAAAGFFEAQWQVACDPPPGPAEPPGDGRGSGSPQ